ncbi:MAG TPA: Uma2 family endonuclease [Urbifossiella sp.]|nr:Uma2 family endonuclease [Urbifossiella sp.]
MNYDPTRTVETIAGLLTAYAEAEGYGRLVRPGNRYDGLVGGIRRPDLVFVTCDRVPEAGEATESPPDLVINVITPTDLAGAMNLALMRWLDAGARNVWELFPHRGSVIVRRSDRTGQCLKGNDLLTAPDILPGFSVPVAAFFAGLSTAAPVPPPPVQ